MMSVDTRLRRVVVTVLAIIAFVLLCVSMFIIGTLIEGADRDRRLANTEKLAALTAKHAVVASKTAVVAAKFVAVVAKRSTALSSFSLKNCVALREFASNTIGTQRQLAQNDEDIASALDAMNRPSVLGTASLLRKRAHLERQSLLAAQSLTADTCTLVHAQK